MTVCAVQEAQIGQDVPNIFIQARLDAGFKSRGKAVEFVKVCEKTLTRIETNQKTPNPDEIISMVEAYDLEKLYYIYCEDICPVGQKIMAKSEDCDLSNATIKILRVIKEICGHLDRMVEIAEDNIITDDEIPDLVRIVGKIFTLGSHLNTYKRRVSKDVRIVDLLNDCRKKQKPLAAAVTGRRVGLNF